MSSNVDTSQCGRNYSENEFFLSIYFVYPSYFKDFITDAFSESNASSGLSPFEKAELKRLLELDVSSLSEIPVQGVLGYEQEYWRNPLRFMSSDQKI